MRDHDADREAWERDQESAGNARDLATSEPDQEAPDDDEEPSEADLIRYYHHEGGEDPVTRQQIRDAGRPGL